MVYVNARLGLVIRRCVQSLAYLEVRSNKLSVARAALFTDAQALPQNKYRGWLHPRHTLYDKEFEKGITYVTT